MEVTKFKKGDTMEGKITYFDKVGPDNTDATFAIAKQRASELGIKTILIASTRGETAAKAVDYFTGCRVVAVGHATGYREPNKNEFTDENRKKVESKGGAVLFASHAMTGMTRRPTPPVQPGGPPPAMPTGAILEIGDIIANTLRIMCAGIKVVVPQELEQGAVQMVGAGPADGADDAQHGRCGFVGAGRRGPGVLLSVLAGRLRARHQRAAARDDALNATITGPKVNNIHDL